MISKNNGLKNEDLRDVVRQNNDLFPFALLSTDPLNLFHYCGLEEINDHRQNRCFTVGMFDGVHIGHQTLLKELCDFSALHELCPSVWTFSSHVPKPNFERLMPEPQLLRALDAQGVREVHRMDFSKEVSEMSALQFLDEVLMTKLNAKAIVLGEDAHMGKNRHSNIDAIESACTTLGLTLKRVHMEMQTSQQDWSSSKLRDWIRQGDFSAYEQATGHPYSIGSVVEKDQGLARTLGFPTANLNMKDIACPPNGVYRVQVELPAQQLHKIGMAYLGSRPTIVGESKKVLEVHIKDFQGDLYGEYMALSHFEPLRPEQKFANVKELQAQLERDVQRI